jgi:hypothetical protein
MNFEVFDVSNNANMWLAIVCISSGCKKDDVSWPWSQKDSVGFSEARQCADRVDEGW